MDAAERARMIEAHTDLSRKAAAMIYPRVKAHVEFDELVALGNIGLIEAASRYDGTKGATFATFAWYRVKGSIIDGLRRNTTLPKRVWAKLVALRAASEYLEHKIEREAGAAARGGPPPDTVEALSQIKQAMSAIRTMYLTSLETLREDKGFEPAADLATPGEQMDTRGLSKRLAEAIDQLPDKERQLLTKHYWEGKNLLEAGEEMGISKSWASRLHAQAVDRLRKLVDDS